MHTLNWNKMGAKDVRYNELFMVKFLPLAVVGCVLAPGALGQIRPGEDIVHLQCNVGSFKILDGGPKAPAHGKLQMSFSGTVLISGLEGNNVTVTGNLRKEYQNDKYKKLCYFGTGSITVDGNFGSIQWFGRNMTATFQGFGILRLYGEYDKNLDTGLFWYESSKEKKELWMNGGRTFLVPMPESNRPIEPKARDQG